MRSQGASVYYHYDSERSRDYHVVNADEFNDRFEEYEPATAEEPRPRETGKAHVQPPFRPEDMFKIDENGILSVIVDGQVVQTVNLRGPKGEDGRDGIDGHNGIDGKDGHNGKDGKNGRNGDSYKHTLIYLFSILFLMVFMLAYFVYSLHEDELLYDFEDVFQNLCNIIR